MRLFDMTNEQLMTAYSEAMAAAMAPLKQAAAIWCEMERRGMDLSDLRTPFTNFFPAINAGKLLPEVVLKFGGSVRMVKMATALVPEDQAKLAAPNATVAVMTESGVVEMRKPELLLVKEAARVFGDGRIRSPEEQRPLMHAPAIRQEPRPAMQPHVPRLMVAEQASPSTAMEAAFLSAGRQSPEGALLDLAVEAWRKWPAQAAAGARRDFINAALKGDMTWTMLRQFQPGVLAQAVGWLLTQAEDAIRDQGRAHVGAAQSLAHRPIPQGARP